VVEPERVVFAWVVGRGVTDCEHCDRSFDDEAAYLRHKDAEHPDEMGRIERRRLEELGGTSGDGVSTPLLLAGLAVAALIVAVVIYTITAGSGGASGALGELGPAPNPPGHELGPPGADEAYRPYQIGSAHDHGQITVRIDGESIDFRQPQFQHPQEMRAFHFEAGEARWHAHAQGVTLEYALEATAFGVTNTSFAYDGVVYRRGSNASAPDGWAVVTDATVVYRVNGNTVQPETYVLQEGDSIQVVVEPDRGTGNESVST
jgi:hypothetical protein